MVPSGLGCPWMAFPGVPPAEEAAVEVPFLAFAPGLPCPPLCAFLAGILAWPEGSAVGPAAVAVVGWLGILPSSV